MGKFILLFSSSILCISTIQSQQNIDWSEYIELYNEKGINTESTEFGPSYWSDKVVYLKPNENKKLQDKRTKEEYFDLYIAEINKANALENSQPLSVILNSDYHEGPSSFTTDGNKIYFTRVDYEKGRFRLTKDKQVALKIFSSNFNNGRWTNPEKIALNEENVAMAHPAISYDGNYMIFASDRPGGYGKMDLYIVIKQGNGWSTPTNLGKSVNSSGNDWFPYINKRNYLFYASDGLENAEGLDIFMTQIKDQNAAAPLRMPYPINTVHDDFGLIIDDNGVNGYLTSNRPGGRGKDDIYGYNSLVSLFNYYDTDYNTVALNIVDYNSNVPLVKARVRYSKIAQTEFSTFDEAIFDIEGSEDVDSIYSDTQGKAKFTISEGYTLIDVTYPKKEKWTLVMSNHGSKKDIKVKLKDNVQAEKAEPEIVYIKETVPSPPTIKNVKVDVGAVIVFENIYYDYNSFVLTQGAKRELDDLAKIMVDNPNLKIQLSAHTDSRGRAEYNQDLSQQRANSARDYLVSKGISYLNVQAIGYGETQLRNHCTDDAYCSEAEHIYNRRTEVKILQK